MVKHRQEAVLVLPEDIYVPDILGAWDTEFQTPSIVWRILQPICFHFLKLRPLFLALEINILEDLVFEEETEELETIIFIHITIKLNKSSLSNFKFVGKI